MQEWCTYCMVKGLQKKSRRKFLPFKIPRLVKKNEIVPFAAMWLNLEITIRSKVSQKEKDKYHMIFSVGTKICHKRTYH